MNNIAAMASPLPDSTTLDDRKARARGWFETLRDEICAAFETVEDDLPPDAPLGDQPPGRFVRTPWSRTDHSGASQTRWTRAHGERSPCYCIGS
jgi:coproporphyrinogen III oxidase